MLFSRFLEEIEFHFTFAQNWHRTSPDLMKLTIAGDNPARIEPCVSVNADSQFTRFRRFVRPSSHWRSSNRESL
jgi:hypothetical protein